MAVPLAFVYAISLHLFSLYQAIASLDQIDTQTSCGGQSDHNFIFELQEQKLRVNRLELILEENINDLNAKNIYLSQCEKLIDEMNHEIHNLQSAVSKFKDDILYTDEKVKVLEEKVRLLWGSSREYNFELHNLKSKAQDAEKRLEVVTSKAVKMADIVTEQWVQIQQLEQALQMTERRASTVVIQARPTRCSFPKFVESFLESNHGRLAAKLDLYYSTLSSYTSQAWYLLQKALSTVKHLHHRFQGFIKNEMGKNEFTAAFANNEVVFFVASALITFPILGACAFLSAKFI